MLWLKIKHISSVLSLLSIAGCQSFGQSTSQIDRDGIDIISTGAGTKITFIKKRGDTEILCAPREGDIADTYSTGSGFGFSLSGSNDTISDDDSKGALSLGGRNPEVLLARELLFRACELASNMNADNKTSIQIYSFFLQKLVELSKNESGMGTSSQYSGISDNSTNTPNNSMQSTNENSPNNPSDQTNNDSNDSNDKNDNNKKCNPEIDWNC